MLLLYFSRFYEPILIDTSIAFPHRFLTIFMPTISGLLYDVIL